MPTEQAPPRIGVATRPGLRTIGKGDVPGSADAAHAWTAASGAIGAAVIDGMGHSEELHALVPILAVDAARRAVLRHPMAGLVGAAELLQDPGAPRGGPDAVGITARVKADGSIWIAWAGDCRAYGWDPDAGILTRYTTDHNVAAYLTAQGMLEEEAAAYSSKLTVSFSDLSIAGCHEVAIPKGHAVVLTSDGVHDQMATATLEALVREHQADAQALADALVAAAEGGEEHGQTYRDDATAIVILPPR
ncbi:SpoIIE family protein phosphatase [Streptomyces sp. NPDC051555]|uniref:SpoIIE family protein phosphatase n=1 Tax=Streptomyces sp. NPDC051555 TaxID=3365657 RepID=UPI0037A53B9C